VSPEIIAGVLDKLDESDEETPRVRLVHDEPLNENSSNLQHHALSKN
jgi:hypothetical protein